MMRSGPLNSICDVPGIRVGHAEDRDLLTGTTVIVPDQPALAAVDQRGGGTGSRDTALLSAGSTVRHVHALSLSGGSAYGLDASGGVMHRLRQTRRGFSVGTEIVPIVPGAIIFDLLFGGPKNWDHPPYWDLGMRAFNAASVNSAMGNVGAGLGATAGPLKGGFGTASYDLDDYMIGAAAVVNPIGSCIIPGSRTFWEWGLEVDDELGGQTPPAHKAGPALMGTLSSPLANTTLGVVATNAPMTTEDLRRIAIMAQDGLARAIRPVHGPLDGDTVFALAMNETAMPLDTNQVATIGAFCADCLARAVMRGVYHAQGLAEVPAYAEISEESPSSS